MTGRALVLPPGGEAGDSPLFNRAVQGVYELGSTFKIFTAAQAMDLGLMTPETLVDANAPMKWGKFTIKEFKDKNYGPKLSLLDVIVLSSNVGTANTALQIGGERQQAFLKSLGFFEATPIELIEAPGAKPLIPGPLVGDCDDHHIVWPRPFGQPFASGRRLWGDCERRV
jgi:cell division protein FtsI (penicillin-binding protein 3)